MTPQLPKTLPAFFWHFLKKQPISFTLLFIAPIFVVLETTVLPYCLKIVIDAIADGNLERQVAVAKIWNAVFVAAVAWTGMVIVFRVQGWWAARVLPKFEADIRMTTVNYLTNHSNNYFANQLSGSLANKVSDLSRSLESIRNILCWNIIGTGAVIITSIFMIATVSILFSWVLIGWIVMHLALNLYSSKIVHKASAQNAEDRSTLNGTIVDTISNIVSTKIFAQRHFEIAYINQKQDTEKRSYKNLLLAMNLLRLLMDIPILLMLGFIMYLLIEGWQKNTVSPGDFVFIFNCFWGISFHIWMLGNALTDLFRDVGIAKQALTIINQPHEISDKPAAQQLIVTQGKIEFKNVTFNYVRNKNVFNNKNVTITPGSRVGLVGFSGSGKTTFVNLILRFFEINSGEILIDNQNIADVSQDSLRQNIAMIPQDTSLFHRSLMDNIRYGKLNASDEQVIQASVLAHCDEFIKQIPEGYSAMVGERGIKLSGGQRQRIAIARAILKDAPILILDEATSALDSVTEKQIQAGLQLLMQNRTTIVIAHRLSTLAEMDRILVFNQGQIIEDGTHEQLLNANGHYAHMWQMQAGGFLPEKDHE